MTAVFEGMQKTLTSGGFDLTKRWKVMHYEWPLGRKVMWLVAVGVLCEVGGVRIDIADKQGTRLCAFCTPMTAPAVMNVVFPIRITKSQWPLKGRASSKARVVFSTYMRQERRSRNSE